MIVGVIDPDLNVAGTTTTVWIPMKDLISIMAIYKAGALGTSATLDGKIQQATDVSGTGAKDITGKAITQLTQAGTDQSDLQIIINLRADELEDGFTHAQVSLTVAVASSDSDVTVIGLYSRYEPQAHIASVTEVIS